MQQVEVRERGVDTWRQARTTRVLLRLRPSGIAQLWLTLDEAAHRF